METTRRTVRSVLPPQVISIVQSAEFASFHHSHVRSIHCDALCQLFFFAMSGHAGPIQIDVGVTPVVCRISCGQAVALLKGRRACLADLNVSSRVAKGTAAIQRAATVVASPNF